VTRCSPLLLVLLAGSITGFGQQPQAPRQASRPVSEVLGPLLAKAGQAQAAGNYAAAAEEYRKAVELSPEVPELWANLGLMQQETGSFSAATGSFARAYRLNPSLYVPNLFLGIDYAHSGEAVKAIPYLTRAEKINKADPQAPLALGRAFIAAGNFSAAARELERATALDPKLGVAWFTLGIARLNQVEADARTISEEDQHSPFAGALYAESLFKQSRFGEAASLYKTLLDALPQPPCIRSELGLALIREHDQAAAAAAFDSERSMHPGCGLALLGQARLAIDRGDPGEASSLLDELWNRDHGFFSTQASLLFEGLPSEKTSAALDSLAGDSNASLPIEARNALVQALSQSGQALPESASPAVSEPESDPASGGTADQDYAAGHFAQCEQRLDTDTSPSTASRLRLLAACAYFSGDNQRAADAAAADRALEPRSLEALYWSVKANERLAFQSLARFQQLEPDSARNHVLLADIYQQIERFDDAQTECEKALALAPGDPAAMLGLASASLGNGNSAAAMETARKALERTPEDPELNLVMAEALMDQRQFSAAEPYLVKSLNAKPQMLPRIHALMGKAYAETGRTQDAIEQLKLGASSDVDGTVHYLLSRLYRQIGDTEDATEALNEMKIIKQKREARGVKRVEDPDLSSLESVASQSSTP
jgi:tetratricopeptide (TPR) repeat protein